MLQKIKPQQFVSFSDKILPLAVLLCLFSLIYGVYQALFISPPDYQQGESVRIMYIHVPSAWMSLFVYSLMAAASISFIVWKNPLSAIIGRNAAPIGAAFALVALVTGSLWGKPIWGAWWVWDARLTSMLILFFLYLGYMAIHNAFDNEERAWKASSIVCIIGFVNVPIIKFSVDWWNTLHQPASIIRADGPAIHSSMLLPLSLMFSAFFFYFLSILFIRIKTDVTNKKIIRQKMRKIR